MAVLWRTVRRPKPFGVSRFESAPGTMQKGQPKLRGICIVSVLEFGAGWDDVVGAV